MNPYYIDNIFVGRLEGKEWRVGFSVANPDNVMRDWSEKERQREDPRRQTNTTRLAWLKKDSEGHVDSRVGRGAVLNALRRWVDLLSSLPDSYQMQPLWYSK